MTGGTRYALVTRYFSIAVNSHSRLKCGKVTTVAPARSPMLTATMPYSWQNGIKPDDHLV